jgi:hypothetical protein
MRPWGNERGNTLRSGAAADLVDPMLHRRSRRPLRRLLDAVDQRAAAIDEHVQLVLAALEGDERPTPEQRDDVALVPCAVGSPANVIDKVASPVLSPR